MTTRETETGHKVQVVICDSVSRADGAKKVVVDLIPPQPAIKVMRVVGDRVRELERNGVDLCFLFIPEGDELLAFRREGERLQLVGNDGPKVETFNLLFN